MAPSPLAVLNLERSSTKRQAQAKSKSSCPVCDWAAPQGQSLLCRLLVIPRHSASNTACVLGIPQ